MDRKSKEDFRFRLYDRESKRWFSCLRLLLWKPITLIALACVQKTNNADTKTSDDLGQLETDVKVEGLIGEESDGTPPSTFHVNDSSSPMTQGSQSHNLQAWKLKWSQRMTSILLIVFVLHSVHE